MIAALAAFASSAAPVYLKAGATGANNGTSWADAYTDIDSAVSAALAGDGVIYAAGGLYTFTKSFSISTSFSIYGGFAGQSMDETPATRDTAAHPTIFSGDTGGDDYWVHYAPNAAYSITEENLRGNLLLGPSGVNMPPDFTGDYDGYRIAVVGTDIAGAFFFSGTSPAVLDGLVFAGFKPTDSSSSGGLNGVVAVQTTQATINDCTFVGNYVTKGCVAFYTPSNTRADISVTNCRFLFSWGSQTSGTTSYVRYSSVTPPVFSNCLFLCCSRTSSVSGNVFNGWGGGFDVRSTTVARCLSASDSSYSTSWGGSGNVLAAEAGANFHFADCVFSNCYTACSSTYCHSFISPGRDNARFERCVFQNNRSRVKPTQGNCYALFSAGDSGHRIALEECVLRGNAIEAPQVAATEGSYVLAIVGNRSSTLFTSIANCTFDGNTASAASVAGVTPILCQGVAVNALEAGSGVQTGIANCTFLGDGSGLYGVVQYGGGHVQPLNVVNCVFTEPGGVRARPLYADVPALVNFISCSAQNLAAAPEGVACEGLQTDKVPLVRVDAGDGRLVLVPDAKTPGLRDSADVATNTVTTSLASWNFRPAGAATWQTLCAAYAALSGSGFDAKLIGDAFGAARPAGAFTRGASQSLTATAETGATLVLRRDPFTAGAFDGEAVQSVAKGTPTAAVAATANDPSIAAFAGWYDENGDLYSSSASLSLAAPTADLTILTARFETPPVTLTFDLGGHGTFASTGTDVATVTANACAPFPEVPAFTPGEGWHFLGFDLPATVPAADATYTASFITTAVRVVRVVPAAEAPATQDGTSWSTAYTDIKAAMADAATYRGEVWMKTGAYTVPLAIPMLSNVAIRGGFAGTETSADEADPAAHPTIVTGDNSDNNYWRPGKTGGALATHRIWTAGAFMPPNPDGADVYWSPNGNYGDDTEYAFECSSALVTNAVFDGLTFTCFKRGAMRAASAQSGCAVRNCRFLACGTEGTDVEDCAVLNFISSPVAVSNCTFLGCWRGIRSYASAFTTVKVEDCSFTNNASNGNGAMALSSGYGLLDVRRCRFTANYNGSHDYNPAAAVSVATSASAEWNYVSDCVFERNRCGTEGRSPLTISGSARVEVARCLFRENSFREFKTTANPCYAAGITINGTFGLVRECLFVGNSMNVSSSASFTTPVGSAVAQNGGSLTLLNCTITGNALTNPVASHAATIARTNGRTAVVNCTIDGSLLSGAAAHEIYVSNDGAFAIVNTVVRNEAAGYKPLLFTHASFVPNFANSIVAGFDAADFPKLGTYGFLYDVEAGVENLAQPRVIPAALPDGEPLLAQGVRAARRGFGRPVWLGGDGEPYIHDASVVASKPYRRLLYANGNYFYGSVAGLAAVPDAAGTARDEGRVAPGPLNAPAPVTVLSVR